MTTFSIILSLAVSVDAFLIGAAYGIGGVKIPLISKLITGLCACISGFCAVFLNKTVAGVFSPEMLKKAGVFALVLLGTYFFVKAILKNLHKKKQTAVNKITAVCNACDCDIDGSGVIDKKEAVLLGIGLSGDIATVGFFCFSDTAGAMMFSCLTGVFCVLLLTLGNLTGKNTGIKTGVFKKIADFALPAVIFMSLVLKMVFQ